jgi:hypothetical protein
MYCSFTNYFEPNLFRDHSVLNCVLGILEIYIGCLYLEQGRSGVYMSIGCKLG